MIVGLVLLAAGVALWVSAGSVERQGGFGLLLGLLVRACGVVLSIYGGGTLGTALSRLF